MSELTRDLELNAILASGVSQDAQRSGSTHFQQRRTSSSSGVVIDATSAAYDVADGLYGISDYYKFQATATGVMYVNIRENHGVQNIIVLNTAGDEVMVAEPSKYSSRDNSVTSQRIATSGNYYMYIQANGRSSSKYRIDVDVIEE